MNKKSILCKCCRQKIFNKKKNAILCKNCAEHNAKTYHNAYARGRLGKDIDEILDKRAGEKLR